MPGFHSAADETLPSKQTRRVLVVEDDSAIRFGVSTAFTNSGYQVTEAENGEQARLLLGSGSFDLIVLDLTLPGIAGLELLRELRATRATPVIVVTARSLLRERLEGLELGADDYLVKPFELSELLARAAAIIRRAEGKVTNNLVVGRLVIDRVLKSVLLDGKAIDLTETEFTILMLLASNSGRLVPRDVLEGAIRTNNSENLQNLLDAFIMKLRKKIGKDSIVNRRKEGFLLNV
ncbi:MAG: response regulator transcription factor [Planctomycetota bacterium]|jgi:DNA-binding response OmpR family regulator